MKSLHKPCYNTLRRGYTATHELVRVAAEAKHNIILIYRPETKNLHNTNVELSKASYSKATSPARSLDKQPPCTRCAGPGPLGRRCGCWPNLGVAMCGFSSELRPVPGGQRAPQRQDMVKTNLFTHSVRLQTPVFIRFQCHKLVCDPLLLRPMWTCSPHLSTQLHTCWLVWHEGSIRWFGAWPHAPQEQVCPPRSPRPQPLCRQNRSSSGRGRRGSWWTSETPQWPGQNETWRVDSPVLRAFRNKEVLIIWKSKATPCINNNGERKEEWGNGRATVSNDSVQLLWKSASPKWMQ